MIDKDIDALIKQMDLTLTLLIGDVKRHSANLDDLDKDFRAALAKSDDSAAIPARVRRLRRLATPTAEQLARDYAGCTFAEMKRKDPNSIRLARLIEQELDDKEQA